MFVLSQGAARRPRPGEIVGPFQCGAEVAKGRDGGAVEGVAAGAGLARAARDAAGGGSAVAGPET